MVHSFSEVSLLVAVKRFVLFYLKKLPFELHSNLILLSSFCPCFHFSLSLHLAHPKTVFALARLPGSGSPPFWVRAVVFELELVPGPLVRREVQVDSFRQTDQARQTNYF